MQKHVFVAGRPEKVSFGEWALCLSRTLLRTQKKMNKDKKKKKEKWQSSFITEQRKLSPVEAGWKLAGSAKITSRTRGGQAKREDVVVEAPSPPPRTAEDEDNEPPAPGDEDDIDNSTAVSGLTATSSSQQSGKGIKPPNSRVIVDVEPVTKMLETHLMPCPHCGARLKISFPTVCIASGCLIRCSHCQFDVVSPATKATLNLPDRLQSGRRTPRGVERNTDFAANIIFVLSFVASGDGGTEAGRTLGLMGLPNSTTMASRSFGNIESAIVATLINFTEKIIHDNLCAEVAAVLGDRVDENGESHIELWKSKRLPREFWPKICAGADMGWQQKGSGRMYNRKSGHLRLLPP